MPHLDFATKFAPGTEPPDDEVTTAFFRAFLPDFYFVNTPISRMRRHLQLIRELPETPLIIDFQRSAGAQFTELTLCALDTAQPGLLSKVAGTLSALRLNIHTAWIHTLRDPHQIESGRSVVLDTLILSEWRGFAARPLSDTAQKRVETALTPILSGETGVSQLLARSLRRATPIVVHEIGAQLEAEGRLRLTLHVGDEQALLFRITRLLSRLGFTINHAQLNTGEGSAAAIFFLAKSSGVPFEATETPALLDELRRALPVEHLAA